MMCLHFLPNSPMWHRRQARRCAPAFRVSRLLSARTRAWEMRSVTRDLRLVTSERAALSSESKRSTSAELAASSDFTAVTSACSDHGSKWAEGCRRNKITTQCLLPPPGWPPGPISSSDKLRASVQALWLLFTLAGSFHRPYCDTPVVPASQAPEIGHCTGLSQLGSWSCSKKFLRSL